MKATLRAMHEKRSRGRVVMTAWAVLLCAAAACGEERRAADLGVDAAADAAADIASVDSGVDQGAPGSLTVKVVGVPGMQLADYTREPMAGVSVTADLPGGVRVEQTTSADGQVTFDDVPWSKGTASVTAYAPGHAMQTRTGVTEQDGALQLELIPYRGEQLVRVSGTAQNMNPAANYLAVTSDIPGGRYERNDTSAFDVFVQAGKPFTLYATHATWHPQTAQKPRDLQVDYYGWTKESHAGSMKPIALDLDFATDPLTPTPVKGTMKLPATAKNLLSGARRVQWWMNQERWGLLVGAATKVTEQPGGEFPWEGQYVDIPEAKGVYSVYAVRLDLADWGHTSQVRVDGYPKDDAIVDNFLDAPLLVQPADATKPLAFGETVEWTTNDPEAIPTIQVLDANTGFTLWRIRGTPGTTALALPTPPTAGAEALATAGKTFFARVALCADLNQTNLFCYRHAGSAPFQITAPTARTATTSGRLVQAPAATPLEGATLCVEDELATACATSDAKGEFILSGLPIDKDVVLVAEKSGYLRAAIHRSKDQPFFHGLQLGLLPRSVAQGWESKLGFAFDATKGHVGIVANQGVRPAAGVTFAVSPAAGAPIYFDELTEEPDPSLAATSPGGMGALANLPAGAEYEVSATDAAGKPCAPAFGWPGATPGAVKVKSLADTIAWVSFACP